jgi:pimeloyl-ACP methyl ester carboxylesterase
MPHAAKAQYRSMLVSIGTAYHVLQRVGDPENTDVLICVHGVTRVADDFDAVALSLSSHYRVVCPDVVGRGYSGRLRNPLHYQLPQYVSDMVTLLARLQATTVDWLGTSMGGLIGMGIASLEGIRYVS